MRRDRESMQTEEVFLSAEALTLIDPAWDSLDDDELSVAVGEALEHAYWHWRWLMAIREKRCKLVVVQHKDARGGEMHPHYQIGELFTLSQWHPERAVDEAKALVMDSGDGLNFDLPVDDELLGEWERMADALGLPDTLGDDESELDVMVNAMLLLDAAHDVYVEELGEDFYVATRGIARDMERLLADEFGQWSRETMQVVDKTATVQSVHIFVEAPDGVAVPVVYQPELVAEEDGRGRLN